MDTPAAWPVAATRRQFAGHVIALRTDSVVMPDGSQAERDVIEHPGAVAVVAYRDGQVLLIEQYRHPAGRMLWEIPAGLLDIPGEAPQVAAARELAEEAGLIAARYDTLVDVLTSPGSSDEAVRIFLAREISEIPAEQRFVGVHEETNMAARWVDVDVVVAHILDGKLHNPLTVAGILAVHAAAADDFARLRPATAPWPERPHGAGSKG